MALTATKPAKSIEKKRKAPTIKLIAKVSKEDETYWQKRNDRFVRHQDLFDLKETEAKKQGQMYVYMNDTKVLIEKPGAMVARKNYRIEVPPRGEENIKPAQRIENACRYWRGVVNAEWQTGLHNPFEYDIAQGAFLRGWICSRLMLDDENPSFVDEMTFDAYHVYPRVTGKKIKRVCHMYETTVGDLKEDFSEAEKTLKDKEDNAKIKVVAYYENEAPFWHAVVADGAWVKKPVALDYFPWIISVAKGRFSHSPIGNESAEDVSEYIGEGFLTAVEGVYKLINRFLTVLANAVVKQENPAKVITTLDGQPKEVELSAGSSTYLLPSEGVTPINVGPQIGQLLPLLTSFQDRLNKGTLPGAMFGEGASLNSGWQSSLMMGAAQDTVEVYVEAIALHHAQRYMKRLELFKQFGAESIEILAPASDSKELAGKRVWGEKLGPEDVAANGTYVEVHYDEITPQDRISLAATAVQLVREKIISLRTARSEWVGVDDPDLENQRVLEELIYLNEKATQELSMLALQKGKKTEELKALAAAQKAEDQAAQIQAQQQMLQQGGPPQLPGQGPPPGMDMGQTGLPSSVLPPEAAGAPEMGPPNEMLAGLLGGGMPPGM